MSGELVTLKTIAKKNLNVPGFANDTLDQVLKVALEKAVKETKTPLDDVAVAALYPTLSALLKNEIKARWDNF